MYWFFKVVAMLWSLYYHLFRFKSQPRNLFDKVDLYKVVLEIIKIILKLTR